MTQQLARADAALADGCYDCLIEARQTYRAAGRRERVLDADVLIAVRERELGLPPSDALDEIGRLGGPRAIAVVEFVPSEDDTWPRGVDGDIPESVAPIVRDYFRLALACAMRRGLPTLPADARPLLVYRAEICGLARTSTLAPVRARVPRFVETSYFVAQRELAAAGYVGPGAAKVHLDEVRARFPTSTAAALMTALYHRVVGDWASALTVYDELLARVPKHASALLGKATCLAALKRHDEAIAVASRVITL